MAEGSKKDKPFYKKAWFWIVVALIVGGLIALIVVLNGSGGSDIIDSSKNGLFVFSIVDDGPEPTGILVPVVFSGDSGDIVADDWFNPGEIQNLRPIFEDGTFKVEIPTNVFPKIQSISYITNSQNNIILPSLTDSDLSTQGPYNQFNHLVLGQLQKPNGTNIIDLFTLGQGPSSVITNFQTVNEGEVSYDELKTVVTDNLLFNNYCIQGETNPPSSEECKTF